MENCTIQALQNETPYNLLDYLLTSLEEKPLQQWRISQGAFFIVL